MAACASKADDKGLADGNEAIRFQPKDAPAYCRCGLAYQHRGEAAKAAADFADAERLGYGAQRKVE